MSWNLEVRDEDGKRVPVLLRLLVLCTECGQGAPHDIAMDAVAGYRFVCPTHGELEGVHEMIASMNLAGMTRRSRKRQLKKYGVIRRTVHAAPRTRN